MELPPLLATRAETRVRIICEALVDEFGTGESIRKARDPVGMALLGAYRQDKWERGHELAKVGLGELLRRIPQETLPLRLYSGLVGYAWGIAHLQRIDFEPSLEIDLTPFDETLSQAIKNLNVWHFDLMRGLVGIGVYALERSFLSNSHPLLEEVVEGLLTKMDSGHWYTPVEQLGPSGSGVCPDGAFDVGIAHGVPGILLLLVAASQAGHGERIPQELILTWAKRILASRYPSPNPSLFPSFADREWKPLFPSRLGWCYGDLGIAWTVASLGEAFLIPDLSDCGIRIAEESADRAVEQSGVRDAPLCHGAQGIAHLFWRLSHYFSDRSTLTAAAARWMSVGLDMMTDSEGFGGVRYWAMTSDRTHAWKGDASLLTGAAGYGLSLNAILEGSGAHWDSILLLTPVRQTDD